MKKSNFSKFFIICLTIVLVFGTVMGIPGANVKADQSQVYGAMMAGGENLVAAQNNDGGWDWPVSDGDPTDPSPLNTLGPIAMGLAQAYSHTMDEAQLLALHTAGELLLSKTSFSSTDGYLAAQLDEVFGVTTYTDYVITNFYDKLANGTYERNGVTYDTAAFVARIRNVAWSGSIANGAAWDLGLHLASAVMCGVDTTVWVDGVKAEIDELDGGTYDEPKFLDVLGLSGAIYGLTLAGEDYTPTAGDYHDVEDLAGLADSLASYQLNSGGFTSNKNYVIEDDGNEDAQTSAYALLALDAINHNDYLNNLQSGGDYLITIQGVNGGWTNTSENHEVTGEALWALSAVYPVYPDVWVCESGDCGHPGVEFDNFVDAIDSVMPGGNVHVLAGNYTESFTIYKSLNLLGEGVDHSAVLSGLINITGNDIALDGLTITNPGQPNAVVIDALSSGIQFTDNVFESIGGESVTANVQAIYLQHGSDDVLIEDNLFQNIASGTKSVKPVYVGDSTTTDMSEGVVIRNNTFSNISSIDRGAYAILVNNGAGTTGLVIEGNHFSTIHGGWTSVVGLEGPTPNAVVTGNTFNEITSTGVAIGVHFEQNPDGGSVTVSYNEFNGSGYVGIGIHVNDQPLGYTVNGAFNWWGSDADPAIDPIYGDVDYSPWLGFVPGTSPMTFLVTESIQEAVDEAQDGDSIIVSDGLYIESVSIDKDLTITGESLNTVVQAPAVVPTCFTTSADYHAVICVQDAQVTLDTITVDGLGNGIANKRFIGVAYRNAGGVFQNAQILNIEDTPFSGNQNGDAFYMFNDDAELRSITMDQVLVSDFQKNGITITAGADTPINITLTNNQIIGKGVTNVIAQNGIQIYGDLITGTVQGNTISGIAYDNTEAAIKWVATSILNFYADIDVIGNEINDAQTGLYNIDGGGLFADNFFDIIKAGNSGLGMVLTDPPTAVPSPVVEETASVVTNTIKSDTENIVIAENNIVRFIWADNTDTIGIDAESGYGAKNMDVSINGNTVLGFDYGIVFSQCTGEGCYAGQFTNLEAHFNRIAHNNFGMYSNVELLTVDAENNWWGCNAGPGAEGCDGISGIGVIGVIDADPWLVLTFTAQESEVLFGGSVDLEAGLYLNSDELSTVSEGYLPDGIPVNFSTPDGGSADPSSALTVAAVAETVFSTPLAAGDADVCAVVDHQTLCQTITVIPVTAEDDAYETVQDTTLNIAAPGVLDNDSDFNIENYGLTVATAPEYGQLTLNADGSFTYIPDEGFVGVDHFDYLLTTYVGNGENSLSDQATVTITVTPGIPVTGGYTLYLPFISKN